MAQKVIAEGIIHVKSHALDFEVVLAPWSLQVFDLYMRKRKWVHLMLHSYKNVYTDTAGNDDERNVLFNKWKQAGQILNIIQFGIPTSFTFFALFFKNRFF